ILATLAILGGGIFLVGDNQFRFRSTYRLKTAFQNVQGLAEGAEVRVGGVHKGTVRYVALPSQPDEKVTVEMDLTNATRQVVKKDSIAAIKTEGLLGDKFVEISFGSKEAEVAKNGDTIGSMPPTDISDVIDKASQIVDTANSAVEN